MTADIRPIPPEDAELTDAELEALERKDAARLAACIARGWREETCGSCGGFGVVSDYAGGDFNGAKDCDTCHGKGLVWRSPKGKYALWPGGPFCG